MLPLHHQIKSFFMKYSEFYREIEADGWYIKTTNKHMKYVHPTKSGFIPVGKYKSHEVPNGTLKSMRSVSGTGRK